MSAWHVIGALIIAGFVGAVALGALLGFSGRNRWIGVLLGPVIGIAMIVVAQGLSNESLNGRGGDITPQSLTMFVGIAVIVLYLAGYAVGAGTRQVRAHRLNH